MTPIHKSIGITFVANTFCNFACKYCYLGKHTDTHNSTKDIAESFRAIANRLKEQGVVIHEVILHGAEVTASPFEHVGALLEEIENYRTEMKVYIKKFKADMRGYVQVKTNLYNFDRFYELFEKHHVLVSGSVDLPLRKHAENRVLKNGASSLDKVLSNLLLLQKYPYAVGFSATMTADYLDAEEFVKDIWKLDAMGIDTSTYFYIMFVYNSAVARQKNSQASGERMVAFYEDIRKAFKGTKFERSCEWNWFKEFLGGYCTDFVNCNPYNILVQKSGDVYTCHRAQPIGETKAGNIFKDDFETIMKKRSLNMQIMENEMDLHEDCLKCDYFHLCRAGCPIQRRDGGETKAYTCALQKAIYANNPLEYPKDPKKAQEARDEYLRFNKIDRYTEYLSPALHEDFFKPENNIANLIKQNEVLKEMLNPENFVFELNGEVLSSNFAHKNLATIVNIKDGDNVKVLVKKSVFNVNNPDPHNGSLYLMLLRDTLRAYGDDKRLKMDHIAVHRVWRIELEEGSEDLGEYFKFDLTKFIQEYKDRYQNDVLNQICITTTEMRKYHYEKHPKNVFYHVQTMNLPFPSMKFFYRKNQF